MCPDTSTAANAFLEMYFRYQHLENVPEIMSVKTEILVKGSECKKKTPTPLI